jgi:glutamine amidotransferase
MAVVFAVLTSNPSLLPCELRRLEGQVRLEERGAEARGVGYTSGEDVLLRRFAPEVALQVRALAPREESEALVYQAGSLPGGLAHEDNLQPFRFRHWLFASQGPATLLGPARARLAEALPEYLRRLVRGDTDGELLFFHTLAGLREVGRTDDASLPVLPVAQAVLGAMARLEAALEGGGRPAGVVLTNGRVLVAARGQAPLFYTVLEGSERCEECGLEGPGFEGDARARAHRRRRAVVVASDVVRPQGWLELPPGTAVAVDATLAVRNVVAWEAHAPAGPSP